MRRVRVFVWTLLGAILGALLSALILAAVALAIPPSAGGLGEVETAALCVVSALYLASGIFKHLRKKGISTRLEKYAGISFGEQLFFAGFALYLFGFHRVIPGALAAVVAAIASVVCFAIAWRRPVEPDKGQLPLIDTRGRWTKFWCSK